MSESETTVEPGAPFPDLSLPTLDGDELRFADLRGTKLVLYMWGSW